MTAVATGPGLEKIRAILGLSRKKFDGNAYTELVTITPDMAEKLLPYSSGFRPVRAPIVANYALDMMRDHWRITGESIAFDLNGVLTNGNHRLHGCVQANRPFTTFVTFGIEPEAVLSMDRGTKRELGDYLAGKLGLANARTVASSVRMAYQLIEKKIVDQSQLGLTNEELFAWLQNGHKEITDDLDTVKQWWDGWPKGFTVTHATAILHASRFVEGVDYGKVVNFFRAMGQGENLVEVRSPATVIYRTFETIRRQSKSGRIQQPVAVATTIKALNMYLADEDVPVNDNGTPKAGFLIWKGGAKAESFPVITAPTGVLVA